MIRFFLIYMVFVVVGIGWLWYIAEHTPVSTDEYDDNIDIDEETDWPLDIEFDEEIKKELGLDEDYNDDYDEFEKELQDNDWKD